ncbi:nucleotidyltransferase substrate binding protein [Nibricoccus sp. IMCC34717]|uniref:nucleotidyltransferase substrate binding protein n=1 Tax=Nibricoccus sp. IMCC34717 TaxID=3034021 RepID=UPI00384FE033
MSINPDVRWKQRFQNFSRGLALLEEALGHGAAKLNALEQEGAVQRFEYTFELAWKTLKDFLEASGIVITPLTPKQVLKEAFAAKLITDGQGWIDMLHERNLLSHTYDFSVFEKAVKEIEVRYLPMLKEAHARLTTEP